MGFADYNKELIRTRECRQLAVGSEQEEGRLLSAICHLPSHMKQQKGTFCQRTGSTPIILATFFIISLLSGCGGKTAYVARSAGEAFTFAMESYQKGDYDEAVSGFQRVIFNFPGVELVEEAIYYLADSYFMDEDYLLAANEFKRVSSEFPDGPYALVSLYKLGLCYMRLSLSYQLDQKDTKRAIDSFETLVNRFPESAYADSARARNIELRDKLARKEFESGYYYYKREYFDSAIIYFETLRDEYPQSHWLAPALFYPSKAYEKLELHDDAMETMRDVLKLFPGSAEARKIEEDYPTLKEENRASSQ